MLARPHTAARRKRRGIIALEYLMLGSLVAVGLGMGATELASGYRQSLQEFGQQVGSLPRLSPAGLRSHRGLVPVTGPTVPTSVPLATSEEFAAAGTYPLVIGPVYYEPVSP